MTPGRVDYWKAELNKSIQVCLPNREARNSVAIESCANKYKKAFLIMMCLQI
jgi:hypothetical protein